MSSPTEGSRPGTPGSNGKKFEEAVASQEDRRLKAEREQRGILFWVGMFGLVGWSITVPTLAGVAAGICIDNRWPSEFSWTLTLMFGGLILGCLTAWHWIRKESTGRQRTDRNEN